MWCAVCRAEYVDGIADCPECQVPLVEALPKEELEYIPDSWKIVGEFTDEVQASLAEGLLQENGIDCMLENATAHINPVPVSHDITSLKLWVEPENFAEAQKLLADVENYDRCSECDALVHKDDPECPACGAKFEE